jgi:hypothetical protein
MEFDLFGQRRSPDASGLGKGGGVNKRDFWLDSALGNRTIASPSPKLFILRPAFAFINRNDQFTRKAHEFEVLIVGDRRIVALTPSF